MRSWLRAVVVAAAALGSAAGAGAETLTDALIAAYRNSNLLDQNRAVLRAADEDVAVAVSSLRPVIAYAATAGWRKPSLLRVASVSGSFSVPVKESEPASLARLGASSNSKA